MSSRLVNARVDTAEHARYSRALKRLGISMSTAIKTALGVISESVEVDGWSARRVWVDDGRIIDVGEKTPAAARGLQAPIASYVVIAPDLFWRAVIARIQSEEELPR